MSKIVLISFWFIEYTIQLANALSDKNDVFLLLPDKFNYLKFVDKNVKTYQFHCPRLRYPTNILMVYRIVKIIKAISPDVVHVLSSQPWMNLFIKYIGDKYPLVTTIHDVKPHLGDKATKKVPFRDLIVKHSNQLIVHGEELKLQIIKKYNLHDDIVHAIPHGELSFYKNFSSMIYEEEKFTILFFGRIFEYKGLKYLIESEPNISRQVSNLKIIIAGEGDNFEQYRKSIMNLSRYEIYNEYITNDKLSELFQRANLVVLPYIDGSQSGVVAIAYAFGKPVIVTKVGSIHEAVIEGKTGFIVPPQNSDKLSEAIIEYLKNEELQDKMHKEVIAFRNEYLTWDKIAQNTSGVYQKAISKKI